jgi:hypothetical protein
MTPLGSQRLEFWSYHVDRHRCGECAYDPATGNSSRWRRLDELGLVVSEFLNRDSVGIFVRGPRGSNIHRIADRLLEYASRLEETLGVPMGMPPYLFVVRMAGNYVDVDSRAALSDWLRQTADRHERALRAITRR